MKIILLGPPGAGKGTEGRLLTKEFGLKRLSVGVLFRRLIKEKVSEGRKIEEYVRQGLNVPMDLLFPILSRWFLKHRNGFVVDNFPRSKEQLELFKKLLKKEQVKVDKVFHLRVSQKTALKRLLKRRQKRKKTKTKRIDDTLRLIKKRYQVGYAKEIKEILAYFQNLGVLTEINGEQSIEKVHQEVLEHLKAGR